MKIFLPTVAGFTAIIGLIELEDNFHDNLFPLDLNLNAGPEIGGFAFLLITLTIPFIFCLLFQPYATLPFWEKIKKAKRILGLKLSQIVAATSLLFALLLGFVGLYKTVL